MAEQTKIEWCHHTMNPWRGCTKVSPGCARCYAETLSRRNPGTLGVWGDQGTRIIAAESYWRKPLKWNREAEKAGERRRVFCASLADVFEDRPELVAPRVRLFHLINETPHLDWLLLTKRPQNVRMFCLDIGEFENVWLGVSVENQATADERIPLLLKIPAAVRFLSCEPLLGPVQLRQRFADGSCDYRDYLTGQFIGMRFKGVDGNPDFTADTCEPTLSHIDWVIVGGESGRGARPCNLAWVRSLVQQCHAAGTACFVKQLGSRWVQEFADGPIIGLWKDSKGGDLSEFPTDVQIREFPR